MMDYSPKSSPRRSPAAAMAEGGGSAPGAPSGAVVGAAGNPALKFSISLGGQKPAIIQKGPFYLMKQDPLPVAELTGANNLMQSKGLENSYIKLTTKRMKDSLSSFLPNLPGVIDTPGAEDNSSLRGLIEKPPVGGKELHPLSHAQLAGFRLHPGPLPDQYRISMQVQNNKKKKKAKKSSSSKHRGGSETPLHDSAGGGSVGADAASDAADRERRREKKHKNKDKDKDATESDKERKKRKKEKKKKKNKDDKD